MADEKVAATATETQGGDAWKPPTREEWEAAQRQAANKAEEAARLHKKLTAKEEADKAAQEEAAKARGEYENLYKAEAEKAKAVAERLAKREAMDTEELESLIKDWPDDDKALIVGNTPEDKLAHARKLAKRFAAEAKGGPGTRPPGARAVVTQFGGYESEEAWAKADYPAYKAHRDKKK